MKILFLVNTPNVYTGHVIEIDRPDLTRKLDCINTWVPDVLAAGHDVLFYTGGADKTYFDETMMTLYLDVETGYEPLSIEHGVSVLFNKNQAAYRWILQNKEFDMVFSGEDDMYINISEFVKIPESFDFMNNGDCMTVSGLGGGGFLLKKKALEVLSEYKNTINHVADHATLYALNSAGLQSIDHFRVSPFYWPAELYGMVHYTTGKRAYLLHHTLKYFQENGYTNRKIILGSPLRAETLNELVSYETTARKKTVRWYDFTTDSNNWEYHGGYAGSLVFPVKWAEQFWPYAEKATKYFVLDFNGMIPNTEFGTEEFFYGLNYYINNCQKSLIDEDNLILTSLGTEEIPGWKINNTVKTSLKLTFEHLESYNFYTRQ
jgi:hypothetical protein